MRNSCITSGERIWTHCCRRGLCLFYMEMVSLTSPWGALYSGKGLVGWFIILNAETCRAVAVVIAGTDEC